MAELGVIASIVGIAGVGIKLSKTLFEIGDKAMTADTNLQRLATNVSLFAQTLKHFAEVMKVNEHLYSPEFEATADQILRECRSIFHDLTERAVMTRRFIPGTNLTVNDAKRKFSILGRVKEYFEKSKVDWLLAQLEYLKTTLSVLIQTLQLAAVTANAKQDSEELTRANEERIEREKVHIETLIIARQLSFLVVLQQNNQQSESAKASDSAVIEEGMSVSPVESDDSVEEIRPQKLLTEGPATSTSLVELGRGNLKFLDDVIPREPSIELPTLNPAHNQIIDQLLGRWTKLPEMELEINERKRITTKEIDLEEQALPPYSPGSKGTPTSPESLKTGDVPAPDLKLHLIDSNSTLKGSLEPVAVNTVSVPAGNLEAPPNQLRQTSRTPPPPLVTHTTLPGAMSSLNPPVVDSPTLHRTLSSPEPEMHVQQHQQMRAYSPQPGTMHVPPFSPPQPQRNQPPTSAPFDNSAVPATNTSPRASFSSPFTAQATSSRPGSSHQPIPRGQAGPAMSPQGSLYGSSPDSEFDDDNRSRRLGLGIPWRIRIGSKYWDFLDERLVGPRTPYLPTEPMSYLYSHDHAETEIAEKWVCEEAIKERNFSYIPVKGDDQVEPRWKMHSALKFHEIDDLVERTIDIYRRKKTQNQQPYPPPPPPPPPVARGMEPTSRTQPMPIPTGFVPNYHASGPVPPLQMPQDPMAQARVNNSRAWEQMSPAQQRNPQFSRSFSGADAPMMPPPPPPQQPPRSGNLRPDYQGMGPSSMGADPRNVHWATAAPSAASSGPLPPQSSVAGTVGAYNYPPYPSGGQRGYEQDGRPPARDRYDDEDDYDRHRRKNRDKGKKKKKGTATALKVSGLMAMLDSLDAL